MGLVLIATAGFGVWIVLWSLNVKGFDAFLITILMLVIAVGVRNLLPFLPGRGE